MTSARQKNSTRNFAKHLRTMREKSTVSGVDMRWIVLGRN